MATITTGYTFTNNETVTPTKLNSLAGSATVSGIVDADLSASAAIANSKLAGAPDTTATASTIALRDGSGALTASRFNGPLTGAVTGTVTGNVTGTASGLSSPASSGLAKAWVYFDATLSPLASTALSVSSGILIQANKTGHGLSAGDSVTISGATGGAVNYNGTWAVLAANLSANTFYFNVASTPSSGLTTTVYPIKINASYNVNTVSWISTGSYTVNLTAGALSTATYATLTSVYNSAAAPANSAARTIQIKTQTSSAIGIVHTYGAGANATALDTAGSVLVLNS